MKYICRPFLSHFSEQANQARSSKFQRAQQRNSGPGNTVGPRLISPIGTKNFSPLYQDNL